VRPRKGTKDTQGINGDAIALQRWLAAAGGGSAELTPCPYPQHRGTDWQLTPAHPVMCGVCHPPANGLNILTAG
jgi:hypothetical protein